MPPLPSIRSLAKQLRLSVATVSEALRDSRRVAPATRKRVKLAAARVGYRANPLVGATFSALRRSRHLNFFGTLALIDVTDDPANKLMPFHREIVRGAESRAQQLGFHTEVFWLGQAPHALPAPRLQSVLRARNIPGVIFMPLSDVIDLPYFDFSGLSAVQMDNCLLRPRLDNIIPDHYLSMIHALEKLTELGYRRIGVSIEQRKDNRLKNTWSSGYFAFARNLPKRTAIPPMIEPMLRREQFLSWFNHHKPDVIVGHEQAQVDWLQGIGIRVPEQLSFLKLNYTERTAPCAGLDLQPQRMGAVAVESVVAMIHRREQGIPADPITITIEAKWIDGPTLSATAAAP